MASLRVVHRVSPADFNRRVCAIRLVGSVGEQAPRDELYHWRFYVLTVHNGELKVLVFDMKPTRRNQAGVVPGQLEVTSTFNLVSAAKDKVSFEFDPTADITAGMFFEAYLAAGLHRFDFTASGKGCLIHNANVLHEMEKRSIAMTGSSALLQKRLHEAAQSNERIALAMAKPITGSYNPTH